ncbi:MAG: FtsX-like permease family protein [Candidatus Babeliaceae bacterium]|jgi:lipoprotein-releasing system permease protein
MKKVSLLLAISFLRLRAQEKTISLMIIMCCVSIFVASGALALIMAIMNGFEYETQRRMQGIHPDITIRAPASVEIDFAKLSTMALQEFGESIQAITPYATAHALLQSEVQDISSPCLVTAIDPSSEMHVTDLKNMIMHKQSAVSFESLLQDNRILIGKLQAQELGVGEHDVVTIMYHPSDSETGKNFEKINSAIGGIFTTGIEELDARLIYCSFDLFKRMFPEAGVSTCGIKLKKGADAVRVIDFLKQRTDLNVFSWKDLYPALLAALVLEKYAMFIILVLIMLIASMTIVALLFMYVTYKKIDIAILKSMGMADNDIHAVFMMIGMGICIISSVVGVAVAWMVSYLIDTYKLIALPDIYYVSYVPAHIDMGDVVLIFTTIIVVGFIAVVLPLRRIRTISIADIFKQEI